MGMHEQRTNQCQFRLGLCSNNATICCDLDHVPKGIVRAQSSIPYWLYIMLRIKCFKGHFGRFREVLNTRGKP